MRVRDLGALTVAIDGREQPIVGGKAAAMLARLAINANERVSVDSLMEAAWGDRITVGAASTLTSHIWRLRQVLEPTRSRGQPPSVLVNDSDGYRLVCGPATLDSLMFIETAGEVRYLLAAGDATSAVRRAESAIGLWRGTPYGAFAEAGWAEAAVARLAEVHSQLQERRIEALLACGATDAALSDLHPLLAELPFRQSLRALQMDALHRSGRSDQALQAYQQMRRLLVDEVGIEPGPELQELHRRILRNEAVPESPARPSVAPQQPIEVHLPRALTPLVGRQDVLGPLTQLLQPGCLVTVIGPAGCGKTRVAVEAAGAVAPQFPDGVWFVDLTPVADPALVAEVIVSTIGFAGSTGATALQDLRRYLQSRRTLLVLDNGEHVLDGIDRVAAAVLGDSSATPECCLLVTSREPVGIDGETIWTLGPLELPDGDSCADRSPAPSVELFLQRLRSAVPTLPIDRQVLARAADIVVAVDGLPLPIELAAARALSHSLDDIAEQVRVDPGTLTRAGRGPRDHRATVRSAIEWSHRLLSADQRRAHRRLAVLPGAFTSEVASALVCDEADDDSCDGDDLLAQLVHRSMLFSEGALGHDRRTVFRQLSTVRSHARRALAEAAETHALVDRRDRWTAALVAARPALGTLAEPGWYRRIDDDYATVRATLTRYLIDEPCAEGCRLAYRLTFYWYHREQLIEARRWLELGRQVLVGLDAPEPTMSLLSRIWLCCVNTVQRRLDLVRPEIVDLQAQIRDSPPEHLVEVGEALVVLAMGMWVTEEHALLRELHDTLSWIAGAAGDANLDLLVDAVGCCALLVSGRFAAATELATVVQRRADGTNLMADYIATAPLIVGALLEARPVDGLPWIDRCLRTYLQLGTGTVGLFIETRANFAAQLGDYLQAARTYSASRTVSRRAGLLWPHRSWTPDLLDETRDNLGRSDWERAWQEGERLTATDVVGAPIESLRTAGPA